MSASHLYPGFRLAGLLPSVHAQRRMQAEIVVSLRPRRLLAVGCAYGDELALLLAGLNLRYDGLVVTAIDLFDVNDAVRSHAYATELGSRLSCVQLDLLELERLPDFGSFDTVQCGFVLHDVCWNLKDRAMSLLTEAIRPGGHLLVSEIFVAEGSNLRSEASIIYESFLREADGARVSGALSKDGWEDLVGDGEGPGLLRFREEAIGGGRDFFDTLSDLLHRANDCGLQVCRVIRNPLNDRLAVVLMRRVGRSKKAFSSVGGGISDVQ